MIDYGQLVVTGFRMKLALWLRTFPVLRRLPWQYLVVEIVDAADRIPMTLVPRTAIAVRPCDVWTWLVFNCPNHPDERIMLNLSTKRRPYWIIEASPRLELYPSIDALHGNSRCHFWISGGLPRRATWLSNNRRAP
jgi:hypothetical protein